MRSFKCFMREVGPVTMAPTVWFLFLLHVTTCAGFGFKDCAQNFPDTETMWCFNGNIHNLSDVVGMFPDNLTKINLCKNYIREIPPGSFRPFVGLKELDLSRNHLVSLKGGEFQGLDFLSSLNLSYNNISHIDSSAFKGLVGLKTLLLSHNHFTTVPLGLLRFLPAVQEVDMALNRLEVFSCGDSGGSSTLVHLDLAINKIQRLNVSCFPALEFIALSNNTRLRLQEDTFNSNPRLTKLIVQSIRAEELLGLSAQTKKNLTRVQFSLLVEKSPLTICQVVEGMDKLERVQVDLKGSKYPQTNSSLLDCNTPYMVIIEDANLGNVSWVSVGRGNTSRLYLNNCGLKHISRTTFEGYPGLKVLQLNQNSLVIQKDTFKDLTQLKSLGFNMNSLRDVDPDWFTSLKNLTTLSFYKNNINDLPPNVFSALVRLEELYMMLNQLQAITKEPFSKLPSLRKLDLSFNIIHFIQDGSFQYLKNLRYLDLRGNRIRTLTPSILSGLSNLLQFTIHNNQLQFESGDTPFINLSSLEYLELDYQGTGHDIGIIGPHFFKGLSSLIKVFMGHTILVDLHPDALVPLVKLRELYIDGVVMKTTNLSALFSPLKTLKELFINFAELDTLPANLMPRDNSLEILKVKSNHLRTVDKAMLEGLPRLRYFDITSNPLTCTCDNAWFKNWATQNPYTQVGYLYNLQCDNDRRSPYLWQFNDKACTYEQVSFNLFIICSVVDVVFVCVCLVWHTQGWALRYLLLMLRAKLRGRKARGAKFQYDAFISYSSKDEAWVMDQLVPNLERPGSEARLRLCLHHRDFRPGAAVLDNIETAIYSSRHTVCVVTRHFLQSEWCSVEFQLACLRLFYDGSDVLLLVFLEDIPERCLSPYTRLRKIVRKKTYLLWPEEPQEQEAFWVRLTEALKDSEEEEDERERGGDDELPRITV